MIQYGSIRAMSFDCYGTLIDWDTGLCVALRPVLARLGRPMADSEIVTKFAAAEREAERPPYKSYREVLRAVMLELAGPGASPETLDAIWRSIERWPEFSETHNVLRRLQRRFKLVIASNIDDDLFADTLPKLGVTPAAIVTAQQVRSYKPGHAHFHEVLRRLGIGPHELLHVAESRYHDIQPANELGIKSVWVNRAGDQASASGPGGGTPDLVVRTLTELAEIVERSP